VGITSKDILKNGMVFTVEPGIYLPEWGGVRIEDTVVMEHGKIRVLSSSMK
jgi:Xaa-Pro aminopeptidase